MIPLSGRIRQPITFSEKSIRNPITKTKRVLLCTLQGECNVKIWLYRTKFNTYYIKFNVPNDIPNSVTVTEKIDTITNKIFDNIDIKKLTLYKDNTAWGYRSYSIALQADYETGEKFYNSFIKEMNCCGYVTVHTKSFTDAINDMILDLLGQ